MTTKTNTFTRTLIAASVAGILSFSAVGSAHAGGFMSFLKFMSLSGTDLGSGR